MNTPTIHHLSRANLVSKTTVNSGEQNLNTGLSLLLF